MVTQRLRGAELSFDGGIFRVVIDEGAVVAAEDVRAWIDAQLRTVPGCVPVLVDTTRIRAMTREAQEATVTKDLVGRTSRVAVLVGSPVSVMIGNFFLILARPSYPARLFTSEAEARAWLTVTA